MHQLQYPPSHESCSWLQPLMAVLRLHEPLPPSRLRISPRWVFHRANGRVHALPLVVCSLREPVPVAKPSVPR